MKSFLKIFLALIFLATLATSVGGFVFLFAKVEDLEKKLSLISGNQVVSEKPSSQTASPVEDCGEECKKEIAKSVSEAISNVPIETKTVEKIVQTTIPSKQTSYISLGTTYATMSKDWIDVPDSGIYIDLANDYSKSATVSWEASLKVAHSNGTSYARIYDDTNKIAVVGSELITENNSSFKQVSSGSLALWRGRNLYKVQVKSLNGFEITYSGGRIKISY